jgi:hypothetical protein
VPTYSSRDDGIAALKDKAASLDANGLTNVDCYGDARLFGGSEGVYVLWEDDKGSVRKQRSKLSVPAAHTFGNP